MKRRTSKLCWFGAKLLFRSKSSGKPLATDSTYDPNSTLVEERVVLFKARDFNHAIRMAEKEARSYARHWRVNPFGQRVITRYLGACHAFKLFNTPAEGVEVFSSTEVIPQRVSDNAVIDQYLGREESIRDTKRRRNFMYREFSGSVTGRIR